MSERDSICASVEKPEVWKPVVGYESIYEVSNTGRVRGLRRVVQGCYGTTRIQVGCELKQRPDRAGYLKVHLRGGPHDGNRMVHRLVVQAFLDNPTALPFVNHKNFNVADNRVENLEWVTSYDNNMHTIRAGRYVASRGARNGSAVVIEATEISTGRKSVFNTMTDAAKETGIPLGTISGAISRNLNSGGYSWRRLGKSRRLCACLGITLKEPQ